MNLACRLTPFVVLLAACGGSRAASDICAAECDGCCDPQGQCFAGTEPAQCGSAHFMCTVCGSNEACVLGQCRLTSSGSGGGGGGTGGGLQGAGGGAQAAGGGIQGTGGGTQATGGGTQGAGGGTQGTGGGSPPTHLGTSCADALPLPRGSQGVQGVIDNQHRQLFYAVTVVRGDWLSISAFQHSGDPAALDPALSLYDATGTTLLAGNDDEYDSFTPTRSSFVLHRAAATGTLCVKLEDSSTWWGAAFHWPTDGAFTLGASEPSTSWAVIDAEPNTFSTPQVWPVGKVVAGGLDSATDEDVFDVVIGTSTGPQLLIVDLYPFGTAPAAATDTAGSTLLRAVVTLKTPSGTALAQLSPPPSAATSMGNELAVPVTAGHYLLAISRPAGVAAGSNDFYIASLGINSNRSFEGETPGTSSNNTHATAEVVPLSSTSNPKVSKGQITGRLPAGDSADYRSLPGIPGTVELFCASARIGSGLIGFTVAWEDVDGTTLQTETEAATRAISWSNLPAASKPAVTQGGNDRYLKLTASSRSASVTGDYYFCNITLTSP